MKRALRRLQAASRSAVPGHGVTRDLPYVCKPPACSKSEARRGVSCIRSGAYVVWGFSGVKDARSESFLADASASASFSTVFARQETKTGAERGHLESIPGANRERLESRGGAL